jgi:hypothetical protein
MALTAKHMFTTVSVCVTALGCAHLVARAGDLNPPGPPSSTMKTIQEAEPRNFITQADIPFVISAPGSYYLAEDIVAPAFGGAAITVDADFVTIDMRGFAIRNGAAVAFQHGIAAGRATRSVVVRNGTVRGSTSDGIALATVDAVELSNLRLLSNGGDGAELGDGAIISECASAENFARGLAVGNDAVVRNSTFRDNGSHGLDTGAGARVDGCAAELNGGRGVDLGPDSAISGSTARLNEDVGIFVGDNSVAEGCAARSNGGLAGIFLGSGAVARGCTSRGNSGDGFGGTSVGGALSDCVAVDNTGFGFAVGAGSTLRACRASQNDLDGFSLGSGSTADGCAANLNGRDGFRASTYSALTNCTAISNGQLEAGDGIRLLLGATATNCTAQGNSDDGIDGAGANQINACVSRSNADDGLTWGNACRIIGNIAANNGDDGFYGPGTGPDSEQSMIMDNLADANNGDGFDIEFGFNVVGRNLAAGGNTYNFNGNAQYSGEIQIGVPPLNPLSDDPFVNVD